MNPSAHRSKSPLQLQIIDTLISPKEGSSQLSSHCEITIAKWEIIANQHWALIGGSEQQRSAILYYISTHNENFRVAEVSEKAQAELIDKEQLKQQVGLADEIIEGTCANEILCELASPETNHSESPTLKQKIIRGLGLDKVLNKAFRKLSSGETHRLLLGRGLLAQVDLLILNNPLEGIDNAARPLIEKMLTELFRSDLCEAKNFTPCLATSSIYASSRPSELPEYITHIAYLHQNRLFARELIDLSILESIIETLNSSARFIIPELPTDHPFHYEKSLDPSAPLVRLQEVCVRYSDDPEAIFDHLNLEILPFQHWQIKGNNGSGKTTLLKLITGDHPQCYTNNIEVFGYRRGNGESIWDIKRHIGYMNPEMLWDYRTSGKLSGTVLSVVISGLYDSIGLYSQANQADIHTASAWLKLFDLGHKKQQSFQTLSPSDQRLALIARAMIKRPALLILDEPCQNLDANDRQQVLAIIDKLVETNATTLLYVTHHDDESIAGIDNILDL